MKHFAFENSRLISDTFFFFIGPINRQYHTCDSSHVTCRYGAIQDHIEGITKGSERDVVCCQIKINVIYLKSYKNSLYKKKKFLSSLCVISLFPTFPHFLNGWFLRSSFALTPSLLVTLNYTFITCCV